MKKNPNKHALFFVVSKIFLPVFPPLAVCTCLYIWILSRMGLLEITSHLFILISVLYTVATSAMVSVLIGIVRYLVLTDHVQKLGEAVRKIAEGDFSVRLAPLHKEKKGFIENVFNDINNMAEQLASIEMMKDSFIGDVSHELKTPLAVIQNYATLMNDDISSEERRKYAQIISETSEKLVNLTGNILKLNKLEHQVIPPPAEPYALSERLRDCVFNFEEFFRKKNIRVDINISEKDICLYLCCNEDTMEIVWNNLFSNALKFTDPGGNVFISLKEENGMAVVVVQDTGPGMDETAKKHVFDKFYQADPSRSTEGNGLGLALVKKTVELLGGTVTVESELGMGSTFTVSLKM